MSKWALHIEHDVQLYTAQLGRDIAAHTPLLMNGCTIHGKLAKYTLHLLLPPIFFVIITLQKN